MIRTALVAATSLLIGCNVSFPDEFRVEDLRVLNVRVDPPEISLFEGGDLSLDPNLLPPIANTRVRVTALVAHPDIGATFKYDWVRCGPGFRSIPCDAADRSRLDPTPTAQLDLEPVQVLLDEALAGGDPEEFARAFSGDPRDLLNGLLAHINVAVQVDQASIQVDTPILEATKRLTIFEPRIVALAVREAQSLDPSEIPQVEGIDVPTLCVGVDPARVDEITGYLASRIPNRNPELARIEIARLDVGAQTSTRAVATDDPLELAPSQRLSLVAVATSSSSEAYRVIDGNCDLQDLEERLGFSWFVTQGSLSRQLTTETRRNTTFTAPNASDLPSGETTVRIWTVLRDGRGGSDHGFFDVKIVK